MRVHASFSFLMTFQLIALPVMMILVVVVVVVEVVVVVALIDEVLTMLLSEEL